MSANFQNYWCHYPQDPNPYMPLLLELPNQGIINGHTGHVLDECAHCDNAGSGDDATNPYCPDCSCINDDDCTYCVCVCVCVCVV
jgi:hypothetical protein